MDFGPHAVAYGGVGRAGEECSVGPRSHRLYLSCATSAEVVAVDAASHVHADCQAEDARKKPRHEPNLAARPSEHAATHRGAKH